MTRRIRTIIGDDGDKEWLCKHGTGHPFPWNGSGPAPRHYGVHTCDGCCSSAAAKVIAAQRKDPAWVPAVWMETFTGNRFYPEAPERVNYSLADIAHGLSLTCRFGGQIPYFFSVAQHSVLVSCMVAPEHKAWALLHDASEAYMADVPGPVKHSPGMEGYRALEARVMASIMATFGLPAEEPHEVKTADLLMMRNEAKVLKMLHNDWDIYPLHDLGVSIRAWSSARAEQEFLLAAKKAIDGVRHG